MHLRNSHVNVNTQRQRFSPQIDFNSQHLLNVHAEFALTRVAKIHANSSFKTHAKLKALSFSFPHVTQIFDLQQKIAKKVC